MTTDIIARLFLAALTFYTPWAALSIPTSIPGRMLNFAAASAYPLIMVMAALSALIVLDVSVNSVWALPRCGLRLLARSRDAIYMGCAFCVLVPLYSVSKYSYIDPAANYLYLVIFSGALSLAWCDAYAKHGVDRGPALY